MLKLQTSVYSHASGHVYVWAWNRLGKKWPTRASLILIYDFLGRWGRSRGRGAGVACSGLEGGCVWLVGPSPFFCQNRRWLLTFFFFFFHKRASRPAVFNSLQMLSIAIRMIFRAELSIRIGAFASLLSPSDFSTLILHAPLHSDIPLRCAPHCVQRAK